MGSIKGQYNTDAASILYREEVPDYGNHYVVFKKSGATLVRALPTLN